jgi:hypothetical protein
MFNQVAKFLEASVNLIDGATAGDAGDARNVLHDHAPGHESFDQTEVLSEQTGTLVVHSTLVVVNAEGLARRPANQHVEFALLDASGFTNLATSDILDGAVNKCCVRMTDLKRCGSGAIEIVRYEHVETRFLESDG